MMNRGWIIVAIVLGVAAAGGGAAYYLTDKYGSPDDLIADAGFLPAGLAMGNSGGSALPPPPPPGASSGAMAGDGVDAVSIVSGFDHTRQRLVWVLPPGVHAEGPFVASVSITHNGDIKHESRIPLASTKLEPGSRPEFGAGSDVVQLSLGNEWPMERDRIVGVIDGLRAAHGAGGGELDVASDFVAKMDESHRRAYCIEGQDMPIRLYVAQAEGTDLQPVALGEGERILQRTILVNGCAR